MSGLVAMLACLLRMEDEEDDDSVELPRRPRSSDLVWLWERTEEGRVVHEEPSSLSYS